MLACKWFRGDSLESAFALLEMHETKHVPIDTCKLPLACVQLSPAPLQNKKETISLSKCKG